MVFFVVLWVLCAIFLMIYFFKIRKNALEKKAQAGSLAWVQAVEAARTPEELFKLHPHRPNWSAGERNLSDRERLKKAHAKQAAGEVLYRVFLLTQDYTKLKEQKAPPHELLKFCVNRVSGFRCGGALAQIVGIKEADLPQFATDLLGKTLAAAYGGDVEACNTYRSVVHELSGNSFFSDCHIARPSLPPDWDQVVIACSDDPLSVPLRG